ESSRFTALLRGEWRRYFTHCRRSGHTDNFMVRGRVCKAFLKTARIDTCRLRGSRSLLLDKRILREKYDALSQKKHNIAVWPQSVQKQSDSERITKHSLLTA